MYAVVRTGGKQYRVSTGEKLRIEKLAVEVGSEHGPGHLGYQVAITTCAKLALTSRPKSSSSQLAAHFDGELFDPEFFARETRYCCPGSDDAYMLISKLLQDTGHWKKAKLYMRLAGAVKKIMLCCSARFRHFPSYPLQPELLRNLIAADMQAVDAMIRRRLESDVVLIRQIAEYIIAGGGKRLRPALVFLAAGATGYRGEQHVELAAVVEFIHTRRFCTMTLSTNPSCGAGARPPMRVRRCRERTRRGFLYSRAFQIMVGVRSMRVMEVLANATNAIAEGEVCSS